MVDNTQYITVAITALIDLLDERGVIAGSDYADKLRIAAGKIRSAPSGSVDPLVVTALLELADLVENVGDERTRHDKP